MQKETIKTWLIIVLAAALVLTYAGPYLKSGITGAFATDYSGADGTINGSYYKGFKDAPITIVEYSDFQCPYCSRGWQVMKQVEEDYVKSGKVKIIFKNFPLSFHPQAQPAALAALCAGEQGKFWEFHDKLFANQNLLGDSLYSQTATELKLDLAKFNSCYQSQKYLSQINSEMKDGQSKGISGTPGFLVNGQAVIGAQPYSVFQQIIDAELKK